MDAMELLKKARAGDRHARDQMVEENLMSLKHCIVW